MVPDTLAAIGKAFKKCTTKAAQKAGKGTAEKAGKKLSEAVVEKGSDKIQQLLRKRRPKSTPCTAPAKSKETPRDDAMLKLSQIVALGFTSFRSFTINIRSSGHRAISKR